MPNKYGLPKGIRLISGAYRWEARHNGQRITGSERVLETAVMQRMNTLNALQTGNVQVGINPIIQPARITTVRKQKESCPTLKEAVDQMNHTDWKDLKSYKAIKINTKDVLSYFSPDLKLYEITSKTVDQYVLHLQQIGNTSGTCNRKISILSKILKRAYQKGQIDRLPFIERQKESEGRIRYITPEEEEEILSQLKDMPRIHDAVVILIDTGIRTGEMYKMKREDIVPEMGTHGIIYLHETKNGTSRAVPLTLRAKEALERCIKTSKDSERIFPEDGFWLTRQWNKVRDKLGFSEDVNFVPHILRHTCCSRLVQRGAPLKKVQMWMGHKSIQTTMRYAHLSPTELYDMTNLLEVEN